MVVKLSEEMNSLLTPMYSTKQEDVNIYYPSISGMTVKRWADKFALLEDVAEAAKELLSHLTRGNYDAYSNEIKELYATLAKLE